MILPNSSLVTLDNLNKLTRAQVWQAFDAIRLLCNHIIIDRDSARIVLSVYNALPANWRLQLGDRDKPLTVTSAELKAWLLGARYRCFILADSDNALAYLVASYLHERADVGQDFNLAT